MFVLAFRVTFPSKMLDAKLRMLSVFLFASAVHKRFFLSQTQIRSFLHSIPIELVERTALPPPHLLLLVNLHIVNKLCFIHSYVVHSTIRKKRICCCCCCWFIVVVGEFLLHDTHIFGVRANARPSMYVHNTKLLTLKSNRWIKETQMGAQHTLND